MYIFAYVCLLSMLRMVYFEVHFSFVMVEAPGERRAVARKSTSSRPGTPPREVQLRVEQESKGFTNVSYRFNSKHWLKNRINRYVFFIYKRSVLAWKCEWSYSFWHNFDLEEYNQFIRKEDCEIFLLLTKFYIFTL